MITKKTNLSSSSSSCQCPGVEADCEMTHMTKYSKLTSSSCSNPNKVFVKQSRRNNNVVLSVILIVLTQLLLIVVEGCQISEYYCDNRKCVSLDKFCNGVDDCGDGSDEPRHCSPCNRTFYGEVGGTYTIAVHRPSSRESQQPFVCQLTFAAGGSKFGDLVQLIFNSVTLGPSKDQDRYSTDSEGNPSCRDGHVTLNEPDRPATAGHWCGHDWGKAVFFSETSRVTLTLSLQNLPVNPATFAFDFRLTYKFLRKSDATVRYGPPSRPYYRGQLLSGTFCSLIFNSCDKLSCALQTPNFPGLYPRNVTCYYAIRQLNAPVGHRALIQLDQKKDHMIFVRNRAVSKKNAFVPGAYAESAGGLSAGGLSGSDSSSGSKNKVDELTLGDECDSSSDHVTIYDGYTIRDPVLLKFCGGGKFPTITSSGNELLVEFYSAPTDFLLQSAVYTAIQGFHVDVDIKYLPVGSHTYVENHNCLLTISSFQQKRGFLTSPQHSLPSGTTCTYLLEGSPGEIVWISLLKFYVGKEYGKSGDESVGYNVAGLTAKGGSASFPPPANYMSPPGPSTSLECNTTFLQIWQGTYSEKFNNATLLAHLCEDTPIKRTCEFMLTSPPSKSHSSRACHPDESFISIGPQMSLKLKIETTTVLRPTEFKLYYEFVDTRQDAEGFYHPSFATHPSFLNPRPNLPKFQGTNKEPQTSSSGSSGVGSGAVGINSQGTGTTTMNLDTMTPKFPVGSCSRIFRSQNRAIQAGSFTSPRNVFYFGRGGITNLTCIYRFQGGRHERVKVTFNTISLSGGYCKSEIDANSGRSMCRELSSEESSSSSSSSSKMMTEGRVELWEAPWNDSRILKECLCEAPNGPLSFMSVTATFDIVLNIRNMQAFHDQNHFAFEGRYEFIKHPDCSRQQKLKGSSGSFSLKVPEKVPYQSCTHHPWEIEPQSPSHYVFLTIPGRTMKKFRGKRKKSPNASTTSSSFATPSSSSSSSSAEGTNSNGTMTMSPTSRKPPSGVFCSTRNRILVYSGGFSGSLLQIICPEDSDSSNRVHIYSDGWESPNTYPNFIENPRQTMTNLQSTNQLILELVSVGPGSNAVYDIKYMQISRRDEPLEWNYRSSSSSGSSSGGSSTSAAGNVIGLDGSNSGDKVLTPGDPSLVGSSGSSGVGGSGTGNPTSSAIFNEIEDDVCFKFKCPELNACINPSLFCDGVENCPSGWDESECEFFPIPKTYLIVAGASLITFLVLICCFGCLVCKKRRAERQEKLLMSSRTPTEEMFFAGTGTSSSSQQHQHHHSSHSREIVC